MATQAKVIIKAEDNITKAMNYAKNSLTSLENASLSIGKTFKNALGAGESFSKVKDTILELSRVTLESKDKIKPMVSELAALSKSSDEIDKISKTAVYLSNVTGKDLNSSMTTLLNTYNMTTTQLKRLGIDVNELTKEELKNGVAVDRVITSLKVYSDELARTGDA